MSLPIGEVARRSGLSPEVRARVEAARAALDELDAALDEKERALAEARAQLRSWREELDPGEPWPDTPIG